MVIGKLDMSPFLCEERAIPKYPVYISITELSQGKQDCVLLDSSRQEVTDALAWPLPSTWM